MNLFHSFFLSTGRNSVLDRAKRDSGLGNTINVFENAIRFCLLLFCGLMCAHILYTQNPNHSTYTHRIYIVLAFCFQFTKPHFGRSLLNFFVCVCVCSEYKFGALFVINACNNKDTISSGGGGGGNKRYYLEFWPRIPLPFTLAHTKTTLPSKNINMATSEFECLENGNEIGSIDRGYQ